MSFSPDIFCCWYFHLTNNCMICQLTCVLYYYTPLLLHHKCVTIMSYLLDPKIVPGTQATWLWLSIYRGKHFSAALFPKSLWLCENIHVTDCWQSCTTLCSSHFQELPQTPATTKAFLLFSFWFRGKSERWKLVVAFNKYRPSTPNCRGSKSWQWSLFLNYRITLNIYTIIDITSCHVSPGFQLSDIFVSPPTLPRSTSLTPGLISFSLPVKMLNIPLVCCSAGALILFDDLVMLKRMQRGALEKRG